MKLKSSVSFLSIKFEHVDCHSPACLTQNKRSKPCKTGKKVLYSKYVLKFDIRTLPNVLKFDIRTMLNILEVRILNFSMLSKVRILNLSKLSKVRISNSSTYLE